MVENGILKPSGGIQHRGGTYAALNEQNPLLARREIVVEVDTGRMKVGDGVRRWNALNYTSDIGGMSVPTLEVTQSSQTVYAGNSIELTITTNSDGEIELISSDNSIAILYFGGYYVKPENPGNANQQRVEPGGIGKAPRSYKANGIKLGER